LIKKSNMKTSLGGSAASKILSEVKFDQGFHFYTSLKHYTGITAISLPEFEEKLKIVDARAVNFHFQRHDFQKWIEDTLRDTQLAKRIDQLNSELSEENLRKEILETVQKRITELQKVAGM
jgi:ATP-dependent Lon protease